MPHDPTARGNIERVPATGYVVGENEQFALRDLARAMSAVGSMCDEMVHGMSEIPQEQMGSLFRVFARQVNAALDVAPFTWDAPARPPKVN